MKPKPLQILGNAQQIAVGTQMGTPGIPIACVASNLPVILKFILAPVQALFISGSNIEFVLKGQAPVNLGIYGPNPSILSGQFGRMRAPKLNTMPDEAVLQCQGNYKPATYYLVIRSGPDGGPAGDFTISLTQRQWQVFGSLRDTWQKV